MKKRKISKEELRASLKKWHDAYKLLCYKHGMPEVAEDSMEAKEIIQKKLMEG